MTYFVNYMNVFIYIKSEIKLVIGDGKFIIIVITLI